MADRIFEGGCLCGQVRFRFWGKTINTGVCHCRICQKAMGSPYFARVLVAKDQTEITGQVARFNSSPFLARLFCPACGARFGAETNEAAPIMAFALAALDEPNAKPPRFHIWTSSKLDWVSLDDGLPQFETEPGL